MSPAMEPPKGPAYVVLYFPDARDVVLAEDGHSMRYPVARRSWLLTGRSAEAQGGLLERMMLAALGHGGSNGDGGPK